MKKIAANTAAISTPAKICLLLGMAILERGWSRVEAIRPMGRSIGSHALTPALSQRERETLGPARFANS